MPQIFDEELTCLLLGGCKNYHMPSRRKKANKTDEKERQALIFESIE
jgi:hypothetical protein